MTALSIRHMNFTLQQREHEQARQDAAWYANLPAEEKVETHHYWWIQRKAKRGKKWIFVAEFFGTKSQIAEYWRKNYQGKGKQFRLRHMLKYQ